eukprot:CAMPEP_0195082342 /NCGR_PEP_ID=MMETSP0448-20130528/23548_1 /TAXON_ID=66468 /ORGANISM="Heterocapsa triquestra, Strain CCMP 448" /LENGTH=73 /DNA_ID=CAMNT_0040115443 /DNA_START=239 /DNA_END=458 /DNA_ORIENTATION=+
MRRRRITLDVRLRGRTKRRVHHVLEDALTTPDGVGIGNVKGRYGSDACGDASIMLPEQADTQCVNSDLKPQTA